MNKIKSYPKIPVTLPRIEILKRLGYNRQLTDMSSHQANIIEAHIEEAFSQCLPQGRYIIFDITSHEPNSTSINPKYCFLSKAVAEFLKNSMQVVLMAGTVGHDIMSTIKSAINTEDAVKAMIYDAVASETADACLDWLCNHLKGELPRTGHILTKYRYSAGYGDFPLSEQKKFYELLKLNEMGITLSESYILNPEKTVTALAGIE